MWLWDVAAADSEWDVYELWKEMLGLGDGPLHSLDDQLSPSVSGGWSRLGDHWHLLE